MTDGPSTHPAPYNTRDYWQGIKATLPEDVRAEFPLPDQVEQEGSMTIFLEPISPLGVLMMAIFLMDSMYSPAPLRMMPDLPIGLLKTVEMPVEMRKQLRKLSQDTERLMEDLKALDSVVTASLFPDLLGSDTSLKDVYAKIDDLVRPIAPVHQAAERELTTGIARPHPGPNRGFVREHVMMFLVQAWEDCTGKKAGYTLDPSEPGPGPDTRRRRPPSPAKSKREYRGPFLDFAEAVAKPVMGSHFRRRDFADFLQQRNRSATRRKSSK